LEVFAVAPIVCFTSDFGLADAWVGVVHAVMLECSPDIRVVDISHEIDPFDIRRGAVLAVTAVHQLPGLTHLVVVDPGVGGERRDLMIVTGDGTRLVGPDNGVLVPAARRAGGVSGAWSIDPNLVGSTAPLATFHARDVLAPAAARLALGIDPSALGSAIDPGSLAPGPFPPAHRERGYLVSEVLDIDRFGSMRIGVDRAELDGHLEPGSIVEINSGHTTLHVPYRMTFSDVGDGEPVALFDSSGWLTVAVNGGSAAGRYGFEPGHQVRVLVA
jgi:S-adenosylmethionine hydrolase